MTKQLGPFTFAFWREDWGWDLEFAVQIGKTIYRLEIGGERE